MSVWPSATKWRRPPASRSASPDAKPWYAQSKKSCAPVALRAADNAFHWSMDGSTPVGLCAQAWSRIVAPDSAADRSSSIPSKSSFVRVAASR